MKTHAETKTRAVASGKGMPVPNALACQRQLRKALLRAGVQPRLEVGAADDALEREADAAAQHALHAPEPTTEPPAQAPKEETTPAAPKTLSEIAALTNVVPPSSARREESNIRHQEGKFPPYLTEELLDKNVPAEVHAFVKSFIEAAYKKEIDACTQKIALLRQLDASLKRLGGAIQITSFTNEIGVLTGQENRLIDERDKKIRDGLKIFDDAYASALRSSEPEDAKAAMKAAGQTYNEWVFYGGSSGEKIQGKTALYVSGIYHNPYVPQDLLDKGDKDEVRSFIRSFNEKAFREKLNDLKSEMEEGRKQLEQLKKQPGKAAEARALELKLEKQEEEKKKLEAHMREGLKKFDEDYVSFHSILNRLRFPENMKEQVVVLLAGQRYNAWAREDAGLQAAGILNADGTLVHDADEIDINDIQQSGLGNCAFLASTVALAHTRPELIKKMIRDNQDGTYTVTFHRKVTDASGTEKTEPVEVTVDLTLPSSDLKSDPSGDEKDGAKEVWTLVLEKAYAKYKGSYGVVDEGEFPSETLYDLTGIKSPGVRTSSVSEADFRRHLAAKRPMVVQTAHGNEENLKPFKLVQPHAYAVMDLKTDDKGQHFLILHNPWGFSHPKPIPLSRVSKLVPYFYVCELP